VVRRDSDANKQAPISGVRITAEYGARTTATQSDVQGEFRIVLPVQTPQTTAVTLRFRHSDYEPLDTLAALANDLYVIRMTPIRIETRPGSAGPPSIVSNVSVRYSAKIPVTVDVGTRTKIFQAVNQGNVQCGPRGPCSPDGQWQASRAAITLDAEQGNQFRNARLSCIAGPCPFTRVERDDFSRGGRTISATVLNWSDTTTFLIQAEVVQPTISESVRRSYPVVFDRTMNFSLPGSVEGLCLEAEINGVSIVFPLGPALKLSWADCHVQQEPENNRLYRCGLRPGYEFR
jgi:hypothetical protein